MQALDDFSIAYSQMQTALPARVDPGELTAFATRADHASKSAKELALAVFAFTVARGKNRVRYPLTDTGRRVWDSVRVAVPSKKHCDLGLRLRRYRDPGCRRRLVAVEACQASGHARVSRGSRVTCLLSRLAGQLLNLPVGMGTTSSRYPLNALLAPSTLRLFKLRRPGRGTSATQNH
jgi:hypothetical protein